MRSLLFLLACSTLAPAQSLRLQTSIPLPKVQGRIDHLSVDLKNQRLFVAALGNNTVEVIDLKTHQLTRTIPGLHEPQGVFYLAALDRLYVANGADGTLRVYDGTSFKPLKSIPCGDDADNVRYDAARNRVWVGYGSGALAEFEPDGRRVADIQLDAHPESFQLERHGPRIFVNLPKSRKIAVIDRDRKAVVAAWNTGGPQMNYPMALDEADGRLFVVCRQPAKLVVLDTGTGKVVQSLGAVGDCDDVFYDAARKRIYATGGEGAISVFEQHDADRYQEAGRIQTLSGARTSFFSPDLNQLFVAVRSQGSHPAEIRVYEVTK